MKRSISEPTIVLKKTNPGKEKNSENLQPNFKKENKQRLEKINTLSKTNIKVRKNKSYSDVSVRHSPTSGSRQVHNKPGVINKNIEKVTTNKFGKKAGFQKRNGLMKKKVVKLKEFPKKLIGKDGKPEWNKVKDETKKLKENRKVQRTGADQYQLSIKAKVLWEKLRKKNQSAEKKEILVNELFMLLKGRIPNVVHSHDMARVVQWMLKLGSAAVRTSICEELCADIVSYIQSKYASFCVKRALRYSSKTDRHHLIASCQGHFLKLLGYAFSSPVVEMMYSMFASAEQRRQMHKEMYGEMHVLLPPDTAAIENIPVNMRAAIVASTKGNLTKLLDKKELGLLQSTLFQSVLYDFLISCSEEDRIDILELIQGDILDLLKTKEGSRVALLAVWHATNKMKKVIVKAMKGKVKEIATSEIGHVLLLALFDSIDDTVLVKKALIPELLNEAEELAKNELGRKVILYLVAHRDPAYFHPQQMEIFSKGDIVSKRKKDAGVRKQEMLEAVSDPLLQKIANDPATWFGESSVTMVSLAVLKSGKGEALQKTFEKLAEYILDPSSLVEVNNRQFHVVEHSAINLLLKKLIQQDQSHPDRTQETFSMVLASKLSEENLNHILQFNRGCFLLVLLFESMNEKVCKVIKSKITYSMEAFLKMQETTGSKILLKKIDE